MTTVAISPKFQVVIPKEVREAMHLTVGMRVAIVPYGDRIELIPIKSLRELKGALEGMDTTVIREKDRI